MEINLLFAVFLIPFVITGDKRSHLWNLPRLQDDQKENADNRLSGTTSLSDKPRWMADGAILAQVFPAPTRSAPGAQLRVRRLRTQIHSDPESLAAPGGTSTQTHPTEIASHSDAGSLQLNTPVSRRCLRNASF